MNPGFILILILISSVLGGIGMALGARHKSAAAKKAGWIKYAVFLLIVGLFTSCILFWRTGFILLSVLVILGGAIELWSISDRQAGEKQVRKFNFIVIPFYVLIGYSVIQMAITFSDFALVLIFLSVFSFDSFSQIFGQIFGKRKLFPKTSPNKTLEGMIGGSLSAILASVLIGMARQPALHFGAAIALGLAISGLALCGDFLASKYKRHFQVKDFSNRLPGQGGILDRFDSWLFTGAVLYWVKQAGLDDFILHLFSQA